MNETEYVIVNRNHQVETRAYYAYSQEEAEQTQRNMQETGGDWDVYRKV